MIERGKVLVISLSHAFHLQSNNVAFQSFSQPNKCGTFTRIDPKIKEDLDTVDDKRYAAAPEVVVQKDRELCSAILKTITNPRRRTDYETASPGSGTTLLQLIAMELAASSAELGVYNARKMAALRS